MESEPAHENPKAELRRAIHDETELRRRFILEVAHLPSTSSLRPFLLRLEVACNRYEAALREAGGLTPGNRGAEALLIEMRLRISRANSSVLSLILEAPGGVGGGAGANKTLGKTFAGSANPSCSGPTPTTTTSHWSSPARDDLLPHPAAGDPVVAALRQMGIDEQGAADRIHKSRLRWSSEQCKVLTGWLESHVDHPYPTEAEKAALARETGATLERVCNWLINARSRELPRLLLLKQHDQQ